MICGCLPDAATAMSDVMRFEWASAGSGSVCMCAGWCKRGRLRLAACRGSVHA